VTYKGTFEDGKVFDASEDRGAPFTFKLGINMVIKGWDVGVASMKVGEKALLICKPNYAYGEGGRYCISPPHIHHQSRPHLVSQSANNSPQLDPTF